MFERIARVFKSWLGYFISFAEDPEVMLQESIEEMRNTLPRLNQILVTTRATSIRLEQEKEELERKERQLTASIQAALKDGSPESRRLAEDDAATLQQVRQDLASTSEQLIAATHAFENAQLSVEDIKSKLRDKMEQARRAIQESKKAAVLKGAASALAELDTYGTAATTDKYLDQIKQKAAEAKASVEVATGGLNVERIKNERRARQLQAQSILSEFETEMGLRKPDATKEAAPFPTGAGSAAATAEAAAAPAVPERTPER
ncbi:MAG TPA: PspA/IM30 family protein [Thermoanaerobaculia bacterium]|nr:PspA/IM30 family protein [Thermoanaerobaculia bacterium]